MSSEEGTDAIDGPLLVYDIDSFTPPAGDGEGVLFERVLAQARAAEAAGFDLLTVMDHYEQLPAIGADAEPMLEAYSTLAAIATRTERIGLGTLVTGVTYHNPAVLAKTVTTIDVISGGRAFLGVGAAWHQGSINGTDSNFRR